MKNTKPYIGLAIAGLIFLSFSCAKVHTCTCNETTTDDGNVTNTDSQVSRIGNSTSGEAKRLLNCYSTKQETDLPNGKKRITENVCTLD
jgi:hypothetical protein